MPEKRPDPVRLEALRRLPKEITETLSKMEVQAFLHEEVWPDSLREKLENFMEAPESP